MSWRLSPLPRDWKRRRLRVLIRDRWRCRIRGPKCTGRASEVDHIDRRDDHRYRNLRAACSTCHGSRTGLQAQAAGVARFRPREPHPGVLPAPPDPYVVANASQVSHPSTGRGVTPQVRAVGARS